MNRRKGLIGVGVAVAAVGAGAVLGARRDLKRIAGTSLPEGDELFIPPDDVTHHHLPAHDGGKLHVVERGSGQPLVLLHGITLRWDIWSPQLHQMSDRFRVIACDLRGHGQSEKGTDGYGLDVLAHDVATVLESLDLTDVILVGHSMGGMTAMRFCDDFPEVVRERVAGLGLVATAATFPAPPLLAGLLSAPGEKLVERIESARPTPHYKWDDNNVSRYLVRLAFGDRPAAAAVEQVRTMISSMPQESFVPSGVGLLAHDALEAVARIPIPTMVVVGSRDMLTPPWCARQIARALPGCELHELARAGHQLMQERPTELAGLIDQLAARARDHILA